MPPPWCCGGSCRLLFQFAICWRKVVIWSCCARNCCWKLFVRSVICFWKCSPLAASCWWKACMSILVCLLLLVIVCRMLVMSAWMFWISVWIICAISWWRVVITSCLRFVMVDMVFCVWVVSMLWSKFMLVLSELRALRFFCTCVAALLLVCVFCSAACV